MIFWYKILGKCVFSISTCLLLLPQLAKASSDFTFQFDPGPVGGKIAWLLRLNETSAELEQRALLDLLEVLGSGPNFTPLEQALKDSELTNEQVHLLQDNARAVVGMDVLWREGVRPGGYALGLTMQDGEYALISEKLNMKVWQQAYQELTIDFLKNPHHTERFMEEITSSDRQVVFLVPSKVLTYAAKGVTRDEFEWLLKHPQRMKNVTFAFGAYELINSEMIRLRTQARLTKGEFSSLIAHWLGIKSSVYDDEL